MNLLTTIGIAGTSLAAVSGMLYGSYVLFIKDSSKSIIQLLKENGKKLLTIDTQDTDKWNTNWSSYVTDNTAPSTQSTKDFWELNDWSSKKGEKNSAPDSFKNKCNELSKKLVFNKENETYKKVEKYCTK